MRQLGSDTFDIGIAKIAPMLQLTTPRNVSEAKKEIGSRIKNNAWFVVRERESGVLVSIFCVSNKVALKASNLTRE